MSESDGSTVEGQPMALRSALMDDSLRGGIIGARGAGLRAVVVGSGERKASVLRALCIGSSKERIAPRVFFFLDDRVEQQPGFFRFWFHASEHGVLIDGIVSTCALADVDVGLCLAEPD